MMNRHVIVDTPIGLLAKRGRKKQPRRLMTSKRHQAVPIKNEDEEKLLKNSSKSSKTKSPATATATANVKSEAPKSAEKRPIGRPKKAPQTPVVLYLFYGSVP
jgi:hypothetical protein